MKVNGSFLTSWILVLVYHTAQRRDVNKEEKRANGEKKKEKKLYCRSTPVVCNCVNFVRRIGALISCDHKVLIFIANF